MMELIRLNNCNVGVDLTTIYNTAEKNNLDNEERISLILSNDFFVSARDIGYNINVKMVYKLIYPTICNLINGKK